MPSRLPLAAAPAVGLLLMACMAHAALAWEKPATKQRNQGVGTLDASGTPSSDSFTHVISRQTEYYTDGPQQGRPADGTFPVGMKVNVLRPGGSYSFVQAENGVQAHVSASSLERLPNESGDAVPIVAGQNRFALELYSQLRSDDGNLFFSPSSIWIALAMTQAGARGVTEKEIADTLHLGGDKSQLDNAVQSQLASWQAHDAAGGYRLNVANRLWGARSYEFLPRFLEVTRTKYGAELARLDFAANAEAARGTINGWVEEQTANKITDLIPPGAIQTDTKLVLTNAVYFKGDWTEQFEESRTKDEDFHITTANKVKVPLMHQQESFRYAAADGLQLLELPYGNKSLSMIVILPDEVDGLPELETKLSHDNLERWMAALRSQEVEVYLPRFETTASFDLGSTLRAMGMPSAFDPSSADFSGMTGGHDLFISKVVHKAFVDVNEEGTEAAAATGVIMAPTSMPVQQPNPVFRADHPFAFLIRDNRNEAILFLGRLVNPEA